MAPKRKASVVTTVVSAITEADALPADLRNLLGKALPSALSSNKADRHQFETEVVEQAREALGAVGKAREAAHAEALAKQGAIVSPAERTARDAATKEADAKQKEAQSTVEACDIAKKEADKVVDECESSLKLAKKEESEAEKTLQKNTKSKATLEGALTNEFASLTAAAKKSEKDSATRVLMALGKSYGVGATLLQAFALACKSEASSRSEFEATTLATVKGKLDEALQVVTSTVATDASYVEEKQAATLAAKGKLEAAQAAQSQAVEKLTAAREALKDAKKGHTQAVASRHKIWEEMRKICDAQDELAKAVANFKEVVLPAFEEAVEKVAPVVEEAPVEEPEEKKQRTEEPEPAAAQENAD